MSDAVRRRRESLGLTQGELARRAGVSRQLVSALEAGRHVPRVDAAIGLAQALELDVESLFGPTELPTDVRSGQRPVDGALLRVGRIGDRPVTAPVRTRWEVADGVMEGEELLAFASLSPGLVVAGCEPGLETLEGLVRQAGASALAVNCSTGEAIEILAAGRVHAAVVHTTDDRLGKLARPQNVIRYRLAGWQVGLAGPPDVGSDWFRPALDGFGPVIQRDSGAAAQAAFRRIVGRDVSGPVVDSHLDAVRVSLATGFPAVAIEPTARAFGAGFFPLEMHRTELWVDAAWSSDPAVEEALDMLTSARFQRQLLGVGGYDLGGFGTRAA